MKEETHVISDPISLCSACLACSPRQVGSASNRSVRAMLSGSNSRISVNSSDWMRFTSLAGMGGRLLARQNGAGLGLAEGIMEEAAGWACARRAQWIPTTSLY